MLFVLENNRYAQTTPIELNLAGNILARFEAFDIPAKEIDTTDVLKIQALAQPLADNVRGGRGPQAFVIHTYRFAPHSKGDDERDPAEVAWYRDRDPLPLHADRLEPGIRAEIETEVEAEVSQAFREAEASPLADPETLTPALDPTP